jgi:membrane-bound ClpP family serine protease
MRHRSVDRGSAGPVAAWLVAVAVAVSGAAAAAGTVVLPVRLPITGTRDTQVEAAIVRHLDRLRGTPQERGVLVLRFDVVDGETAGGSDFGRALELARFLTDERLAGVKTVAWLPDGVTGHAVLVALACDEIAMPPDAVLGPANTAEPDVDDATRVAATHRAAGRGGGDG